MIVNDFAFLVYVLGCQPHIYKYIFLFDFDLSPFDYV